MHSDINNNAKPNMTAFILKTLYATEFTAAVSFKHLK